MSLGDSTRDHTRIEPEAGNLTISTPDGVEYSTALGAIVYELRGRECYDAGPWPENEGIDDITAVDDVRLPSIGQQPVAVPL